jgi:hypothetical protein
MLDWSEERELRSGMQSRAADKDGLELDADVDVGNQYNGPDLDYVATTSKK